MNPLFVYLIKTSLCLTFLYGLFRFTMRNDRNHSLNRFLLMAIMGMSAVIPFFSIQFFYEEIPLKTIETVQHFVSPPRVTEPLVATSTQPLQQATKASINPWLTLYVVLVTLLMLRLILGVIRVLQLIGRAEKRKLQKIVLALVKDKIQPFSFLNRVVLSENDFNENKHIIVAHERAHIKYLHAIDLMVCEICTLLQFFNPFMWLLRRDLKLIHEYQADEAVLNNGIDAKKYQLLVLQKSVGERRFALASSFSQKPILKRLKMMQQKNRKQWSVLKLILFLPLLVILLQAFARPELITSADEFIAVKYTEDKTEKWMAEWTAVNIGKGFFEPEMKDINGATKPNNVLVVLMNSKDQYLVEGQFPNENIKQIVKNYLLGVKPHGKEGPGFVEKEIDGIGLRKVSQGIISYQHDIESSKEMVNKTIRQIGEACLEVRNEKAQIQFNKDYLDLDEQERTAINAMVPVWFKYEFPKGPKASVWLPFEDKPSPEPKPRELLVKYDGSIHFGNQSYADMEEFEQQLLEWKKELKRMNDESNSRHFYRANLTYEHGKRGEELCTEDINKLHVMFWRHNMHIEKISHLFPNEDVKRPLQLDKLKQRTDRVQADAELQAKAMATDSTPVPHTINISMLKNGQIKLDNEPYASFSDFKKHLNEVNDNLENRQRAKVTMEDGVKQARYKEMKNFLASTNFVASFYFQEKQKSKRKRVERSYDAVEFDGNLGMTSKDGKYGLIDIDGNEILPCEYDAIEFDGRLAMTVKNGKLGLIDIDGNIIIPNEYDAIEFDGRLGMTIKKGKLGLIDIDGNIIIPNEYDAIEFDGRLGMTIKKGKLGLIDIDGNIIIPNEYDAIEFDGRLGMTIKKGKLGLIDIDGNIIIPNEYDAIEFDGRLGMTVKKGKQGLIDIDGNIIIPNEYDAIEFDGLIALTTKDGKYGLIDIDGNVLIPNKYDQILFDGSSAVAIKDGKRKTIKI